MRRSCKDCLFYNQRTNYCVLHGTFLSGYEPCEWFRRDWGDINWLRKFVEEVFSSERLH